MVNLDLRRPWIPTHAWDSALRGTRVGKLQSSIATSSGAFYLFFRGTVAEGRGAPPKTPAREAKVGHCPCCAIATHVAVPPPVESGAYSELKELGVGHWAPDGPRAGRRLEAVTYLLDTNGARLLGGWDWAACALQFLAPDPLIRSLSQCTPLPIPTIADAEKHKKNITKDLDTHTALQGPRAAADKPSGKRIPTLGGQTIPGGAP